MLPEHRVVQIESILSREKIIIDQKTELDCERVLNILGKGRNCWFPAFSPFSNNVSKSFLSGRIVSISELFGKGLLLTKQLRLGPV